MKRRHLLLVVGLGLLLGALCIPQTLAGRLAGLEEEQAAAAQRTGGCGDADSAALAQRVHTALAAGRGKPASVPGLSDPRAQLPQARVIVETGIQLKVPARGQVIALATALQESGLRNRPDGDRDSLGLFQQRPSQGWGSAAQIMDPVYASQEFYRHLLQVPGWERMPLTDAAQKVQRSGYPEAYGKHERLATALQQAIAPTLGAGSRTAASAAGLGMVQGCPSAEAAQSATGDTVKAGQVPAGYRVPATAPVAVQRAIRWAMQQLGTPYQWGGSCTDAHGPSAQGRCDCSSLMQRAYGVAGIQLTRTTYTQVHEGRAVSVRAVQPGDLLFTRGTAARPEHVGMYVGSGWVINAPKTGDVVRFARFSTWEPDVLAVRRVV